MRPTCMCNHQTYRCERELKVCVTYRPVGVGNSLRNFQTSTINNNVLFKQGTSVREMVAVLRLLLDGTGSLITNHAPELNTN